MKLTKSFIRDFPLSCNHKVRRNNAFSITTFLFFLALAVSTKPSPGSRSTQRKLLVLSVI
jgi:hypothetical protein